MKRGRSNTADTFDESLASIEQACAVVDNSHKTHVTRKHDGNKNDGGRILSSEVLSSRDEMKIAAMAVLLSSAVVAGLETACYFLKGRGVWEHCQTPQNGVPWCEGNFYERDSYGDRRKTNEENEGFDLTSFMVEPANSRSNYAYLLFGMYFFLWGYYCWNRYHRRRRPASVINTVNHIPSSSQTSCRTIPSINENADEVTSGKVGKDCSKGLTLTTMIMMNVAPIPAGGDTATSSNTVTLGGDSSNDNTAQHPNLFYQHPILAVSYGSSMLVLSFGSWWYHASECDYANQWDAIGMFTIIVFPTLYNFLSIVPWLRPCLRFVIPMSQVAIASVELTADLDDRFWMERLMLAAAASVVVFIACQAWTRTFHYWKLLLSVVSLVAAIAVWMLDREHVICDHSFYGHYGHASWHLLTSFAMFWLMQFWMSERLRRSNRESVKACETRRSISRQSSDNTDSIGSMLEEGSLEPADAAAATRTSTIPVNIPASTSSLTSTSTSSDAIVVQVIDSYSAP
eukprot:CAMPEP_0119551518 /NCGR_PEP_ID=MMETSP1352-20130426/4753_1 /TAXON_ID=265584 /ORGANISM="Stauroneis constricta, Strain CCMP1120" /LENGTH=513 /DNA_ID=CAMNT_0007597591 /DNA_START=135 /DNA_END=1673 /DNA_ORIENTATION=-